MAFNSFPTNAVGGDGVSTASFSSTPTLTGSQLPSYWNNNLENYKEGFAASVGSAIVLPVNSTSNLGCYDSTGSSLWSLSPGSFGSSTNWMGFWMNDAATLLYVVTVDSGTTPDTYRLSTVDLAGAIVNIGSDQPSVEFASSASFWTTNGMIQPDGSGGFYIYKGTSVAGNDEFAVLDATGTFTGAPARMSTVNAASGIAGFTYKTDNGYWLYNTISSETNSYYSIKIHNGTDSIAKFLPYNTVLGSASSSGSGFMQWRDYVVGCYGQGGALTAARKFSKAQINTFASQLATYAGVKL